MFWFKLWNHLRAIIVLLIYKILYGENLIVGKSLTFRKNFLIVIDSGGQIKIGNNCFFNNGCTIDALKLITIGDHSIFGENVKIYDHNHKFNELNTPIKFQGYSSNEITIGKNCWIGSNCTILKGVHIGDNCVIGAGVVVTTDVPSGYILKKCNDTKLEKINFINNENYDEWEN